MSANTASLMPPREELEARTDGHAAYPSAWTTLCGREVSDAKVRRKPPTCHACRRVARAFDEIDGSVPAYWRWKQRGWHREEAA